MYIHEFVLFLWLWATVIQHHTNPPYLLLPDRPNTDTSHKQPDYVCYVITCVSVKPLHFEITHECLSDS